MDRRGEPGCHGSEVRTRRTADQQNARRVAVILVRVRGRRADVTIVPVPQYQYAYLTVNGLPVLVDPTTRRVVYIFRG